MALFNKVSPDLFHSRHHETESCGSDSEHENKVWNGSPSLSYPGRFLMGVLLWLFPGVLLLVRWNHTEVTASSHCSVGVWPNKESAHITCWPSDIVCVCVCVWEREREIVTQLCLTLCDPMHWGQPGSSVHRILQARILEWLAISFSRGIFLT